MLELEGMGLEVGEWNWMPNYFYEEGGFDISAEYGDYWKHLDYYGEFGRHSMFVSEELERVAKEYGYYIDWYNPGVALAVPF